MPESLALTASRRPTEVSERWAAEGLSFRLRWSPADLHGGQLGAAAVVGLAFAVAGVAMPALVAFAAVSMSIGGGFVLPVAVAVWCLRPVTVRITAGELIVHDLAFAREQIASAGFRDGRITVVMRDGRQWQSRALSPRDPERVDRILGALPRRPARARVERRALRALVASVAG